MFVGLLGGIVVLLGLIFRFDCLGFGCGDVWGCFNMFGFVHWFSCWVVCLVLCLIC